MILKRKIYNSMLKWKKNSRGNSALLIDGARRVGKSFMAEEFAKKEYKSYIIIDFANVSPEIKKLFLEDSSNLDLFFQKLSAYYSKFLYERKSLIVFDEVQQFPFARQLIKYLVKDGRYDYIETGSLISLKKNVQDIVIPSEEEHLEMHPLDFEEFLWAMGDETTVPYLKTCFEKLHSVGVAVHKKTMNLFMQYVLVGGMPQSVSAFLAKKDFAESDMAKRKILRLYRDDIAKFAQGHEEKICAIFDSIPAQLSRKEKKYRFSSIDKAARSRSYKEAFLWLREAMIVNICFNSTDPNVGLELSADYATQKCYMADTGLLVTHTFGDGPFIGNDLYKAILFGNLSINEGMLMENVVAQMLRVNGHKLFFYSRHDRKNRNNNMEIDFVTAIGKKIVPIEVKSGAHLTHSSLDKFIKKFHTQIGQPYILSPKDVSVKDRIVYLPLYMAMFL